jgi:uncharacterized membrane protein
MPTWLIVALVVVVVVAFVIVLGIAMLSEMGTKRKTGTMHGGGRSSKKSSSNRNAKSGSKKR